MQILPDFLSEIVKEHGETIAEYYSDKLYESLLRKNRGHLLVKLAKSSISTPSKKPVRAITTNRAQAERLFTPSRGCCAPS